MQVPFAESRQRRAHLTVANAWDSPWPVTLAEATLIDEQDDAIATLIQP